MSARGQPRATDLLDLVNNDVCGPNETPSESGARDFITFMDDYGLGNRIQHEMKVICEKAISVHFKNKAERQNSRCI